MIVSDTAVNKSITVMVLAVIMSGLASYLLSREFRELIARARDATIDNTASKDDLPVRSAPEGGVGSIDQMAHEDLQPLLVVPHGF